MKFIRNLLVSVFFIGYFPIAPGTAASTFAAIIYCFFIPQNTNDFLLMAIIIVVSLIFIPIIKSAEKDLGKDSPKIVIDEIIGYFVAILFLPYSLMIAIYAFVLFRVFDVAKPPPINRLQDLPHGLGVISDDVLAGIYANIILQILLRIFPNFFIVV